MTMFFRGFNRVWGSMLIHPQILVKNLFDKSIIEKIDLLMLFMTPVEAENAATETERLSREAALPIRVAVF